MMMKSTFPMTFLQRWMSCVTEMEKNMNGRKLPGNTAEPQLLIIIFSGDYEICLL
jgi:hypothetical protein